VNSGRDVSWYTWDLWYHHFEATWGYSAMSESRHIRLPGCAPPDYTSPVFANERQTHAPVAHWRVRGDATLSMRHVCMDMLVPFGLCVCACIHRSCSSSRKGASRNVQLICLQGCVGCTLMLISRRRGGKWRYVQHFVAVCIRLVIVLYHILSCCLLFAADVGCSSGWPWRQGQPRGHQPRQKGVP
jgi:hypothetical protein